MNSNKFKILLNQVPNLGTLHFRKLREEVDKRLKSKKISNILETPINKINCPHCKSNNFIKWGKRNDMQRYKCKVCKKTFNSLTHTPLARLRRKGHWLDYAYCLKEGFTIRSAAEHCSISRNTSFRWRHRFLNNFKYIKTKKLGGIIEQSNTHFRESFKGASFIPEASKYSRKQICIIYNIDRNNNIFDITNCSLTKENLNQKFKNQIKSDSILISDSNTIFRDFSDENKLKYKNTKSNHDTYNTKIIDDYITRFRNWIIKYFKGVATKYLENYVSWFRSLNEFNSGIIPITILYRAKQIEKYRYQPLKATDMLL